ncbi:profilin I [Heterostelium album PN500]|uniref:Profilin n=1 Tax=Heterostelium pallidum (strain ATCC 26659 / Pp 5 / PN500) TaxID=670386 RepID=D3BLB5_HETP5|nr:profilin I [Heterostelium album PN500]EFA77849.1 profilin I [Heterostelium album PN500]|eukprot:XP_020429977.1 profilin I [Heterostelium album PN500]
MSWQNYVDEQLIGSNQIEMGAIIGLDGGVWACSPINFLRPGEGQKLANLFRSPQNVFNSGITVDGVTYSGTKADGRSIYGRQGGDCFACAKTGQCIVIGIYKQQGGNPALHVEKLVDYLLENGF